MEAICLFVSSLRLSWTRVYVGENGAHFCANYFHMHYPFYAN
jgi:hypothetical protein